MKLVEKTAAIYDEVERVMFQFLTDLCGFNSRQELNLKPVRIKEPLTKIDRINLNSNRIHLPPRDR